MKNLVELFSTSKSHYSICKFTNRQGKIAYYAEEAQDLGDFWSLHDLKTSLQHIDGICLILIMENIWIVFTDNYQKRQKNALYWL